MTRFKHLISGLGTSLAAFGKEEGKSCFESLTAKQQAELVEAYIEYIECDSSYITQAIESTLDIDIALLTASGKLTFEQLKKIRIEFKREVEYWINHELSEVYRNELGNKQFHLAEYRADYEL